MAYQPRYMRPFTGTTIVIQDDAITSDKLDDKAVEEKHLGDDVVSERVIGTAAVDTDEIKDGGVKTVDIADRSVTEPKLADGAVTEQKLSFVPSTRPLDPGVGSVEILDDAIIESKYGNDSIPTEAYKPGSVDEAALAGDAVTTVKIKDRNVTATKVALDSIGNEHIKADAVRGTEIQDGAVSEDKLGTDSVVEAKIKDDSVSTNKLQTVVVTTVKIALGAVDATRLAPDAVETVKIKDLNVTAPKLADAALVDRLFESFYDRRQMFVDDFVGATLLNHWSLNGDGGFTNLLSESNVLLRTAALVNSVVRLNWGGRVVYFILRQKPILVVMDVSTPASGNARWRLGLQFDDNNFVAFERDTSVDTNFRAVCMAAGVPTSEDTGVVGADATQVVLKMEIVNNSEVKFYVNGALTNTITTNIPTSILEPHFEAENLAGGAKGFNLDKVLIIANPFFTAPP